MLSRTADNLFWMCRYTERAENTARMLDVNLQVAAAAGRAGARGLVAGRAAHLRAAGPVPRPARRHLAARRAALHGARRRQSSSICACTPPARTRAPCASLTTEVWETYNTTWLELQKHLHTGLLERNPGEFFRMDEVPLAPGAWRHHRHHAGRRSAVFHAHRHAPGTRRQHRAHAGREVPRTRRQRPRRRGATTPPRRRRPRKASSTAGRRCSARCRAWRSTARSTAT